MKTKSSEVEEAEEETSLLDPRTDLRLTRAAREGKQAKRRETARARREHRWAERRSWRGYAHMKFDLLAIVRGGDEAALEAFLRPWRADLDVNWWQKKRLINDRVMGQYRILHVAASLGHVGVARLLVQAGARIDCSVGTERTPLYSAVDRGHLSTAAYFLEEGADPNAVQRLSEEGLTPEVRARYEYGTVLHLFTNSAYPDGSDAAMARLLLAHGANPNARTMLHGGTPLHYQPSTEVAEVLIDAGADVQALNNRRRTPLQDAAEELRTFQWLRSEVEGRDDPAAEGLVEKLKATILNLSALTDMMRRHTGEVLP